MDFFSEDFFFSEDGLRAFFEGDLRAAAFFGGMVAKELEVWMIVTWDSTSSSTVWKTVLGVQLRR